MKNTQILFEELDAEKKKEEINCGLYAIAIVTSIAHQHNINLTIIKDNALIN